MTADTLRRSSLGHLADVMSAASDARLAELRELPYLAQIDLRLDPASAAASAAAAALRIDTLPTEPNTVVSGSGDLHVLWLGPDEWLIVALPDSETELCETLEVAASDRDSVVDISANRTTIELTGPAARDVLACVCPLDLHPRVFGPGQCAQTLLAKAQVIIHQVDERPTYRLLVRHSFAEYATDWLLDAISGLSAERSLQHAT